jgi:Lrp/AsnC family transcriptional regulator for asnA, asnC and gidA
MDEVDFLILSELLKNAQMSFLKIAKKVGVSSFTVKSRFDKMKKEGIIARCVVTIDLSKLGYQGKVFLLISSVSSQAKSVTIDALKKMKNILVISEIIGPFDILAIAPITDFNSIRELVTEVKKLRSVQRVKISAINDTMFPVNPTFGKILSQQSHNMADSTRRK